MEIINYIKNNLDMPSGTVKDKATEYYARFYRGEGILQLTSRGVLESGLELLGLYPEPPAKPTKYSEYVYFSDMTVALARIVSIFHNQKRIGPPARSTRNNSQPQLVARDDSSSDDEQPTRKSTRQKTKRTSPRTSADSNR